jgi:hypothetical protein
LTSLVVRGRILDSRYTVIDDSGGDHRLFTTGYEDRESVLRATDRVVQCQPATTAQWDGGSLYTVPLDSFHTSEAEGASVTIVRSGVPAKRPALVVGVKSEHDVVRYERRELETSEFASVLSEVMTS